MHTLLGTQGDGEDRQGAPRRTRTTAGRVGPRCRGSGPARACERARGLPGLGAWSARARPCVRLREAACARGAAASATCQVVSEQASCRAREKFQALFLLHTTECPVGEIEGLSLRRNKSRSRT
ncbi:UDP-GalNAc:beta-1,3-N-acetylgalactosaminyltransferase 1 isoform X2 [Callorhinus ursinus]|uniref:UDP-GalNAc:beta-1, 3-N-acetylgalactosaminyltransferase 1 isoform X2 n=1 Tax=Callorhinus ursinus TaxID=34884 RepID=UPI003CCFFEF0